MKIMYCITSSSWGGAQLNVLELCQDQVSRGNSVVFVVGSEGPLLNKVQKIDGVKVVLLKSIHREVNLIFDVKAVFDLRQLIKKEKPDILHVHSSKAGTLGRMATVGLRVKTVFTVHGWAFTEGIASKKNKLFFKKIERIISPLTNLFICVSQFDYDIGVKNGVLKKNKKNAIVVHNGTPDPVLQSSAILNRKMHEPIRLVMTARFSTQKDQETLIKAANLLDGPFELVFVGDGETLAANMQLCQALNLSNRVQFVGFQENVIPFLVENDVYILATHYEGLPISIIEAMSYGLPIVASNVGGNSELVQNNKNGFLVKPNDIEDMRKVLQHILYAGDEEIRVLGQNSFFKYQEQYKIKKMLNSINDAYKHLMTGELF